MTLSPAANQPPWLPYALGEILSRANFLTAWEWSFIGRVRPKIENSVPLDNWEQDKLFQVHKHVMRRKEKPKETYKPRLAVKKSKEFYV